MKRVCFVTEELYPFTAGGIGRLIHNLIRESTDDIHFHVLVPSRTVITIQDFAAVYGEHATIHYAHFRSGWDPLFAGGEMFPPAAAFTDCAEHGESLDLLLALRNLANEGLHFDWIEFPDYRGWAYCTVQEKRLDPGFPHGSVVVRVHGTDGMVQHWENRRPATKQLAVAELERKALADADRVIVHLRPIAELYRRFYGFDEAWAQRVTVEFPPVAPHTRAAIRRAPRDLLFVTKVQPLKRPDLFVRGAATFLKQHPEFTGRAVIAAHVFEEQWLRDVEALIPPDLASRFVRVGAAARESLVPGNLVVIPSEYESLCLAAYEAAAAGATLVLNGACAAFGEGTPFAGAPGCFTFDGTARGLAATLAAAWQDETPAAPSWHRDPPYWSSAPAARVERGGRSPRVSVLITNYQLAQYLPEALRTVAASTHLDTEVIVVDDASPGEFDREALALLEQSGEVRVIRNPANLGLAASRNIALDVATGDYVLPLDADDCLGPRFLSLAVDALERHREFDVVVPQTAFFDSDEALAGRSFCDWALFLGDVPSLGLIENRLSSATALVRRSTAARFRYDEKLPAYEDWNLWLRMATAGVRFLVTNAIHFFYRRREGSMVRGVDPLRRFELMAHTLRTLDRPLPAATQLHPLLVHALATLQAPPSEPAQLRHQLVDRLDERLKRIPYLQPTLRRLTLDVLRRVKRDE